MKRRTKIVCTLGPASSDQKTIERLIDAGMDVARLNFSHGTHENHDHLISCVRAAAEKKGRPIPILQDLQGPKMRIGEVIEGGVLLHEGSTLLLTPDDIGDGDADRVHVDHSNIAQDVEVGGRILLDDGLLELEVSEIRGHDVVTRVIVGGALRSNKGVNLPNMQSSTSSLTDKDEDDLRFGLSRGVDMIALSFVRTERDVIELVNRVRESGVDVGVLAKIEKPEAVADIDEILLEADAIMVARGDLGIEMDLSKVPITQKYLVRRCLGAAKPVITATQMLESMIRSPRPTRAEASDVANAVLDGTDAVMLSGETAIGNDPVRVVEVMNEIILNAEKHKRYYYGSFPVNAQPTTSSRVTHAISYIATQLAREVEAVAIACLTHSGATARSIARHRPDVPVYAFTDTERVVGQLGILWGTKAFHIPFQNSTDTGVKTVHEILLARGLGEPGDRIVITAGMPLPEMGRTNMVHVSQL